MALNISTTCFCIQNGPNYKGSGCLCAILPQFVEVSRKVLLGLSLLPFLLSLVSFHVPMMFAVDGYKIVTNSMAFI